MANLSTACEEAQTRALDRFRSIIAAGATLRDYRSESGSLGMEAVCSGGGVRDMSYWAADVTGWDSHSGDLPDDALPRLFAALSA